MIPFDLYTLGDFIRAGVVALVLLIATTWAIVDKIMERRRKKHG